MSALPLNTQHLILELHERCRYAGAEQVVKALRAQGIEADVRDVKVVMRSAPQSSTAPPSARKSWELQLEPTCWLEADVALVRSFAEQRPTLVTVL